MNVAVFSLSSYEDVQKVFNETKAGLGEILSAFEFFDKQSYELVKKHMKEGGEPERKVFETEGEFYVLVETGGSNNDHDEEVSRRCDKVRAESADGLCARNCKTCWKS
jgi:hypothetical protein